MTDIKPRIVEGEPVCSGNECPLKIGLGQCAREAYELLEGYPCPPGLRAQRDALQAVTDKVLEILRANHILIGVIPGANLESEHMPEAVEVLVRSVVQVGQMADTNAEAFNAAMQERDALQAERDALAHEVAHPADAEELRKLREERDAARREVCERQAEKLGNPRDSKRARDSRHRAIANAHGWAELYVEEKPK
jgi:hypothetical protein